MSQPQCKMALRNMKGEPVKYLFVEGQFLPPPVVTASPAHHILVVDRSGSMWGSMEQLRELLLKLLTLSEYQDADLRVSLVSYSSTGDVTTHFERIVVSDIMTASSPWQAQIKSLRPTGLTCISQALREAARIARMATGEVCCVTLHSDGYANDRSPSDEARQIATAAKDLASIPGVFASCIAYSDYSDFNLLSSVANAVSGSCVLARNIRQVWDELAKTQATLAGNVAPEVKLPLGNAWFQAVFCQEAGKVIAGACDLSVRGLPATAGALVYRYFEVSKEAYDESSSAEVAPGGVGALVLAKGLLANGKLIAAKQALVASRVSSLLSRHARALTPTQIGDLSGDLDQALTGTMTTVYSMDYGLPGMDQASVLEILSTLAGAKGAVEVDMDDLRKNYAKRGLKRVTGSRKEDGTIETPWVKVANRGDTSWSRLLSVDPNDSTANINIMVERPIELRRADNDQVIDVVAGRKLNELRTFNNYTVVGDGQLCLSTLRVRTADAKVAKALNATGFMGTGPVTGPWVFDLALDSRPLVPSNHSFASIDGIFEELAKGKVMISMLSAMLKGRSEELTPEQLDELKYHFLTPAMNVSLPSTTAHPDLAKAIQEGHVDTRLSYKVEIGSPSILSLGKLHSANKFLERFYTATGPQGELAKPTMLDWWDKSLTWSRKVLSSRTKVTAVDLLMATVFDALLIPKADPYANTKYACWDLNKATEEKALLVLSETKKLAEAEYEALMDKAVRPLVLYVGATGMLPDEMSDLTAMTADDLGKIHPELALGKSESEGTFFVTKGGTVISIYVKGENFTTAAGLAALASDEEEA